MQTVDGQAAKGLTQAEMQHLFSQVQREVEDRSADHPDAFPLGKVIYSLDNASAHKRILQTWPPDQLNIIPAHSPDIHKVIEHPLNVFNHAWYEEFTLDRKCTTCERSMALASEILHRTKADSVWRDIQTLPDTFRSIIQHGGDWAAPDLC